jgi:chromosome partitioning protein
MVDTRANFTRRIISLVEDAYGGNIRIFEQHIPHSIRAVEATANGVSIFTHDPNGKVAAAYAALTQEVLADVA